MARAGGCLKNGCLGCLGVFVLLVVILGVNALIVTSRTGDESPRDAVLSSRDAAETGAPLPSAKGTPDVQAKPAPGTGWVILELGQGEFHINPGAPGSGVVVEAGYDESIYELQEYRHTWPDSSWVYHVRFHRTISGLQAVLAELMSGLEDPRLDITLDPELAMELNLMVREGGVEAELGGLWLTGLDIRYDKAGVSVDLDAPLREPLPALTVNGRMGGCELAGVGHASPRELDLRCRMGGTAVDLSGDWRNDCDARLQVFMGGMEVDVPSGMDVETDPGTGLRRTDAEVGRPTLRVLEQKTNMGEIEIR